MNQPYFVFPQPSQPPQEISLDSRTPPRIKDAMNWMYHVLDITHPSPIPVGAFDKMDVIEPEGKALPEKAENVTVAAADCLHQYFKGAIYSDEETWRKAQQIRIESKQREPFVKYLPQPVRVGPHILAFENGNLMLGIVLQDDDDGEFMFHVASGGKDQKCKEIVNGMFLAIPSPPGM